MKKFICLVAAAVLALVAASSCNNNKFGDHKFFKVQKCSYQLDQTRYEMIADIINEDSYFREVTTKSGYFNEQCGLAIEEFRTHCKALDIVTIESLLQGTEWYSIEFWSMDPAQNWISYVFTAGDFTVTEN